MSISLIIRFARLLFIISLSFNFVSPSDTRTIKAQNYTYSADSSLNYKDNISIDQQHSNKLANNINPYETQQPSSCSLTNNQLPLTSYGNEPHNIIKTGNDERFVAGSGGCFDQYLNRDEVTGGFLRFYIDIDRYYSTFINPTSLDMDGFLPNSLRDRLVAERILPKEIVLEIETYDVDYLGSPSPNSQG